MRYLLARQSGFPRSAAGGGILFLICLSAAVCYGLASRGEQDPAPTDQVRELTPGNLIQEHLKPGQSYLFNLRLFENQFAQILVQQQGADVGIEVISPDGTLYIKVDTPTGFYGLETASIVAHVPGTYLIKIYPETMPPPGDFSLRIEPPRTANASDEMRVTAERLFIQAQNLRYAAGRATENASEAYGSAINKYKEALAIWSEIGDLRGQGYCLSNIGRSHKALGEVVPALDYLSQGSSRLQEAGDLPGQAYVLNETGTTYRELGDLAKAVVNYENALQIRLTYGDRYGLSQLYNNLGLTYSYMGYQAKAADNYGKALPLWQELGLQSLEINTLNNLAKAHAEMGELDQALTEYQKVLDHCNYVLNNNQDDLKRDAIFLKPYALNGLGLVYDTWADTDNALIYYQDALGLFQENKNSRGEADVLDNLGLTHAFLGDGQRALEYFNKALVIRQRLKEPKGLGITLSNLGFAYSVLEDNQEALNQLTLALPFSQSSRDRRFEAYTLVRIGMAHLALHERQQALESYEKALAIQQEPDFVDRRGQAITLDKMAEALALSSDSTEQALSKYQQALDHWKKVNDDQGRAISLFGIARIENERNNLANARDRIEEALTIVESLRHKVTARQLQMTYFAEKQDMYALGIEVRMRLYELMKETEPNRAREEIKAALSLSERARARNLLDLLAKAHAEANSASTENTKELTGIQRQISELSQIFLDLQRRGDMANAALVERRLTNKLNAEDDLIARKKKRSPSTVASTPAQLLTPAAIQQLLDEQTLLLEYSLHEKRSYLWAVSRTTIDYCPLPGRAEIETKANRLRRELTVLEPRKVGEPLKTYMDRIARPEQYLDSARELSKTIFKDCGPLLGNKRLVIVAAGALQNIPFEVLPAPESDQKVLLNNEIVYLPSASTLALLRVGHQRNFQKTLAVFADPVFDDRDTRVRAGNDKLARLFRDVGDTGDAGFTLTPLMYSRKEANDIASIAKRGARIFAGIEANRVAAISPTLKQFRIVHFATHGFIDDKHPELSGLILSTVDKHGQPADGYLTLHDIYNLDLPVNLVVLSACQTGLGKYVPGEGVIGLTRGFMYAGAQRLVVSLWLVNDEATAELMKRFYWQLLRNNQSPAAALRQAKIEMRDSKGKWSNAYYWSGFILQGDWK